MVEIEINSNFIDFFKQCNALTTEEIANKQLVLDKKEYHPNENDKFRLATDEEFSNITQKYMQSTQEYLSNFEGSNESERSFIELAHKAGKSFEFHKAKLLEKTRTQLLDLLLCKNLGGQYFTIKYLKDTFKTDQLTKIFQNVRTLANKLNADIENDFAAKVMEITPKKEDSLKDYLLEQIQFYEDYALGKRDIEIFNPDKRSESSIISNYIPIAIFIGGFAIHMYFRS